MANEPSTPFKREIGAERVLLMLPFNVVMVGRIRGNVDPLKVNSALDLLRIRHPLLAVRVETNDDGMGWYVADGAPRFEADLETRQDDEQWLERIKKEFRMPFSLETGPLVRCALIHSPEVSEIVLCANHAICDGMSMGYLLRDLLKLLVDQEPGSLEVLYPPIIDSATVQNPPRINPVIKFFMSRINKKWAKKGISFRDAEMHRMHDEFWKKNADVEVAAWNLDPQSTSVLVDRCRLEHVTVNSALWTAFLAAQHELQGQGPRYRRRSGLAVSTRDKLTVSVGEAFGFYASSLTLNLTYSPRDTFWDNARAIHLRISNELSRTNLFRMLIAGMVHPTLQDALYFTKYGLLNETIPRRILHKKGWHQLTYGYVITNVGRFDIPTSYGQLRLEAVYGPSVYSDVEEKVIGAITVGGTLSCILSYNESVVHDGRKLMDAATAYLKQAADV
jgi:NRPS condensation-like uncharacterized protein